MLKQRVQIRLKCIIPADFRYGTRQLYLLWEEKRRRNGWAPLKVGEAALLVSISGDQLLFILPSERNSEGHLMISTRLVQFATRVQWNPLRLKEYADSAGLDLDPHGLKRFEEHFVRMQQAKARARAQRLTSQVQAAAQGEGADYAVLR